MNDIAKDDNLARIERAIETTTFRHQLRREHAENRTKRNFAMITLLILNRGIGNLMLITDSRHRNRYRLKKTCSVSKSMIDDLVDLCQHLHVPQDLQSLFIEDLNRHHLLEGQ